MFIQLKGTETLSLGCKETYIIIPRQMRLYGDSYTLNRRLSLDNCTVNKTLNLNYLETSRMPVVFIL